MAFVLIPAACAIVGAIIGGVTVGSSNSSTIKEEKQKY